MRPDVNWQPVTTDDIRAYLGLRLYMSALCLPNLNMYWSGDSLFGGLFAPKVMKRDRFDKISQYFHAATPTMTNWPTLGSSWRQ